MSPTKVESLADGSFQRPSEFRACPDQAPIPLALTPMGQSGGVAWGHAHVGATAGPHIIEADVPFDVIASGHASDVSYGYVGDSWVAKIADPPPPPPQRDEVLAACRGSPRLVYLPFATRPTHVEMISSTSGDRVSSICAYSAGDPVCACWNRWLSPGSLRTSTFRFRRSACSIAGTF